MKANYYQDQAQGTAIYNSPMYPFGSLTEEAGEVVGKLNKFTRKHSYDYEQAVVAARDPESPVEHKLREDLKIELGDLQWQVAMAAFELGFTLEDIMLGNLSKLCNRAGEGTLDGAGDTR